MPGLGYATSGQNVRDGTGPASLKAGLFFARCFGLDWHSDIALEHFDSIPAPTSGAAISVRQVSALPPRTFTNRIGRAEIGATGFRFNWNDEAVFDCHSGERIDWLAGRHWRGGLPASFYSSVAGLALASRGLLPLHASSIVVDGKAWLIAGKGGAGKSTLTADLLAMGSCFLADDLTVLAVKEAGQIVAFRGRPSIRLHPHTAERIDATDIVEVPEDPRGKLLVRPNARAEDRVFPVGGVILIGGEGLAEISRPQAAAIFGAMVFRPRICAKLPCNENRREKLSELARQVRLYRIPGTAGYSMTERAERARIARDLIGSISPGLASAGS